MPAFAFGQLFDFVFLRGVIISAQANEGGLTHGTAFCRRRKDRHRFRRQALHPFAQLRARQSGCLRAQRARRMDPSRSGFGRGGRVDRACLPVRRHHLPPQGRRRRRRSRRWSIPSGCARTDRSPSAPRSTSMARCRSAPRCAAAAPRRTNPIATAATPMPASSQAASRRRRNSVALAVRNGPVKVTPQPNGPLKVEGNLEIVTRHRPHDRAHDPDIPVPLWPFQQQAVLRRQPQARGLRRVVSAAHCLRLVDSACDILRRHRVDHLLAVEDEQAGEHDDARTDEDTGAWHVVEEHQAEDDSP